MAELISSGKIIQKPEIVVDPSFFLPGGIVDARLKRADEIRNPNDGYTYGDGWSGGGGESSAPNKEPVIPADGDDPAPAPATTNIIPPTNIRVVSQKAKFGPDGTMTVDVVIEFDDVDGADGYDVRFTKAGDDAGTILPVTTLQSAPVVP